MSELLLVVIGLGSGLFVSGAVFAVVSAVGLVPRMAQKTGTQAHIRLYETSLVAGGIFAALTALVKFEIALGRLFAAAFALCVGIFFGVLAVSLAEVLDMMPIMTRRLRLQKGMVFLILALALGKTGGALLYALVPGFYTK